MQMAQMKLWLLRCLFLLSSVLFVVEEAHLHEALQTTEDCPLCWIVQSPGIKTAPFSLADSPLTLSWLTPYAQPLVIVLLFVVSFYSRGPPVISKTSKINVG